MSERHTRVEAFRRHCHGAIVAADVADLAHLGRLTEAIASIDGIYGVKVGAGLAIASGLAEVTRAIRRVSPDLLVIYDHQKAGSDIPATGEIFAKACAGADVDAVILFSHGGPATVEAYVGALRNSGLVAIVGVAMTHPHFLKSEGGYFDDGSIIPAYLAAARAGACDFVVPATRVDLTHNIVDAVAREVGKCTFYLPGIGTQGGDVRGALKSVGSHAAFPIVGSSIYKAVNPKAAASEVALAIREACEELAHA